MDLKCCTVTPVIASWSGSIVPESNTNYQCKCVLPQVGPNTNRTCCSAGDYLALEGAQHSQLRICNKYLVISSHNRCILIRQEQDHSRVFLLSPCEPIHIARIGELDYSVYKLTGDVLSALKGTDRRHTDKISCCYTVPLATHKLRCKLTTAVKNVGSAQMKLMPTTSGKDVCFGRSGRDIRQVCTCCELFRTGYVSIQP